MPPIEEEDVPLMHKFRLKYPNTTIGESVFSRTPGIVDDSATIKTLVTTPSIPRKRTKKEHENGVNLPNIETNTGDKEMKSSIRNGGSPELFRSKQETYKEQINVRDDSQLMSNKDHISLGTRTQNVSVPPGTDFEFNENCLSPKRRKESSKSVIESSEEESEIVVKEDTGEERVIHQAELFNTESIRSPEISQNIKREPMGINMTNEDMSSFKVRIDSSSSPVLKKNTISKKILNSETTNEKVKKNPNKTSSVKRKDSKSQTKGIKKKESSSKSSKSSIKPNKKSTTLDKNCKAAKGMKQHKAKVPSTPIKKENATSAKSDMIIKNKKQLKTKSSPSFIKIEDTPEKAEGDQDHAWWLQENNDNSIKWTTLSHNGVLFPPEYVPHNVPLVYDGQKIQLKPQAEEVAGFFAAMLESDYVKNPTFVKNFFKDFKIVLKECNQSEKITSFEKCDFSLMFKYFEDLREKKKNMTKEEKKKMKEEKEKVDEKYSYAILDGRKEKIGNFRVEPPGLFRGRGQHPKTGCLKKRVYPEQITINIGKGEKIPEPPAGHKWGNIVHDNKVAWLATWNENINDGFKYVLFAAASSLRAQSDMMKFEKARRLKKCVNEIRKTYIKNLKDKDTAVRQRATAMYLIDRLALRAGNEKGEDEADTVGCCSLRCEHIQTVEPNIIIFDFLGKDSIRYFNEVEVIPEVYQNLVLFSKKKKPQDMLFDKLSTSSLNTHLNSLMPGLTAKVFRTFNASDTFQKELSSTPEGGTVHDKLLEYNRANRQVAILCNHQRSVAKGFEGQMIKINDKIKAVKFERLRMKKQLLQHMKNELSKKEKKEILEAESDLEDEWILGYIESKRDQDIEKLKTKFQKDNEKEGRMTKSDLEEKIQKVQIETAMLLKEQKTNNYEHPGKTKEKLLNKLQTLTERINIHKVNKTDKDENKTTALGTSKTNYLDPRISAAWAKLNNVPIEKLFNRSLREKFRWAIEVDKDWKF